MHIRSGSEGFPDEGRHTVGNHTVGNHTIGASQNFVLQQSEGATAEDHPISGIVYAVSPSFSEQGRSFFVKIRTEEGGEYLKDGMFVACRIIVQEKQDVVLIPSKSVISREGEDFVFLADTESGTVSQRHIFSGIESPLGNSEVLDGLEAGELVVINQRDRLTDGIEVNILQ